MKLLKIGSAPSNDIVLNSQYVSARHADLIVLDDGTCIIEDKGSTNGTYLDPNRQNRLQPGVQQPVRRGDVIVLGNTNLLWNQVPQPDNNSQYTSVINIGSDFRNDMVVSDPSVSRFHAVLKIDKKGHAFIVDNKSTNGTQVDGVKIAANRPTPVKRGNNIVVGHSDITAQVEPLLPKTGGWIKAVGIVAGIAVLLVAGFFGVKALMGKNYENSVVFVYNQYAYTIELSNNKYNTPIKMRIDIGFASWGTAFFIDETGHMGTCRHVAEPWHEEYSHDMQTQLRQYLVDNLPEAFDGVWSSQESDPIVRDVRAQIEHYVGQNTARIDEYNSILNAIHSGAIKISGESNSIYIGHRGRYYETFNEMERATTVAASPTKDIDVAILRLNSNVTPNQCKPYLAIEDCFEGQLKAGEGPLHSIGYPSGIQRATEEFKKTIEPTVFETKVSKNSGRYTFEIQQGTTNGASGSPVFFKDGKLAGVAAAVYAGQGSNTIVVQAKYLKDLYDKEVR